MVQLQRDLDKIKKAGIQMVGVSYDDVAVLKKFADTAKITFPLLSDKGSKTINAYGIHYQRGLPHPGTFLIDKKGQVQASIFRQGYVQRHSTDELLKAAAKLKEP